jgi:hypothetical protein
MAWPDESEEGYKKVENKERSGDNLWESKSGITVDSCKAVCNSNSRCKSFTFRKSDNVCLLKTQVEGEGSYSTNNNFDIYFKQGEPVKDKKIFMTNSIRPLSSWSNNGLYSVNSGCDNGAVKVSRAGGAKPCSWMPTAVNMCPNFGDGSDLVYFAHQIQPYTNNPNDIVQDVNWNAYAGGNDGIYAWSQNFGDYGNSKTYHEYKDIKCGYNRIPKTKWADQDLDPYFDTATKQKIYRDQCTGPGVTSLELYGDTTYCKPKINDNTWYYTSILDKLKSESSWWDDNAKVSMLEDIATNQSSGLTSKLVEVINSLPSTGWSDKLVGCLNAIMDPNTKSNSLVMDAVTAKTEAYCKASNGNTNSKCGCYNAITYELTRCTDSIKGCEEAVLFEKALTEINQGNPTLSSSMRSNYVPQINAKECKKTTKTDTVLKYKNAAPGAMSQNIATCYSQIINSGTINADSIQAVCSARASSSSTDSTNSDSGALDEKTAASKVTSKSNTMWIIIAIICCCVMFSGVGILLVSSSGGGNGGN